MKPKANPAEPESQPSEHTLEVQQLFIKHQTALRAFILSLQPDFSEAEDILQETFVTTTRKADGFASGTNFIAWVFAIARNKVLESRRRRGRQSTLSAEVLEKLVEAPPEPAFFDVRLMALRRCLESLAPRARELVRLRYHAGRGPEEIARRLAWSPNSVNVALSRARASLRECVQRALRRAR